MNYLSVCSGIEAASVAWHGLGWSPVAFSEIDIDDGDDRVTYRYEQERIRTRENYFTVTVENR